MLSHLLILLEVFVFLRAHPACDYATCNHEGICELVNNVPTCKCFGTKYFQGTFCKELVDNCASSPCRNNAKCTSAVGQYLCGPCPEDFAGQNCDVREPQLFTKWHFHYNRYGYYSKEQLFLTTLETLGSANFNIECYTANYYIDAFETDLSKTLLELRWRKSTDLGAVAQGLGLRHADRLPYQRGYYHVSNGSFWQVGTHEIKIIVYRESRLYVEFSCTVEILPPVNINCVPSLEIPRCSDPYNPLFLDIARFNNFEAIVRKRCNEKSIITFRWWVYNSIETVQLHYFGGTNTTLLKVAPYRMWFHHYGEVMQSYMILIEAQEAIGKSCVRTVARCYVFVPSKVVWAGIRGGEHRKISANTHAELDGSQSRDFALPQAAVQVMTFRWDCSTADDKENKFCRSNMGQSSKLALPAGSLRLGKSYTFSFLVRSIVNRFSTDNATQVVEVVAEQPLYAYIKCVRNCLDGKFTAGQLLHLKAECIDCDGASELSYSWLVSGDDRGSAERLLYTPPDVAFLRVQLILKSDNGGRQGACTIRLNKNTAPSGGDCTIEPSQGVEYETQFRIECLNYQDSDPTMSYQYVADDFTMDRTTDYAALVRLPQAASAKVIICDFLYACTEKQLSVSVAAMSVPQDINVLKEFLQSKETNLRNLLASGDTERAMILAHALLKNAPSLEAAELIVDQMENFRVRTVLEVEQLVKITHSLLAPLKPLDNKKALLFSQLFRKVSMGFEAVIQDDELSELLPEPYKAITDALADMLSQFSEKLENIPEVQTIPAQSANMEDRIAEHYADFADFDVTVLPRIENWLRAAEELSKCIYALGVAATHMHEPTEPSLVLELDGLNMEVFSFEGSNQREVNAKNDSPTFSLHPTTITELQAQLQSLEVLLQVILAGRNPFWWYPDEQSLRTEVVYFSAFSRKSERSKDIRLLQPLEFVIKLLPGANDALDPVMGYLDSASDMVTYEVAMPVNSVLVIRFINVATNLRFMTQLQVKPRGYLVRRSSLRVPAHSENTTFLVINDRPEMSLAFLAVLAADEIADRATFGFNLELKECLSWSFNVPDPQWTTQDCKAALEDTTDSLRCYCHHMSTFAGKVFPTTADTVHDEVLLEYLPINWIMVLLFFLIALLLFLLLLLAGRSILSNKRKLIKEETDQRVDEDSPIIMHIHTGGQWNAGTTANVSITFFTKLGVRKFIIYQDPEHPHLVPNSTCILGLPLSGDEIFVPRTILVGHDGSGRYPTWYCRSIEVVDLINEKTHTFTAEKWLSWEVYHITETRDSAVSLKKGAVFKQRLERFHIRWFQFQPLCGPWICGLTSDRFERTCIWISKICITICIVACYFARTTLETYEEDRERFRNLVFWSWEVLALCTVCYLVGALMQLVFNFVLDMRNLKKSTLLNEY